MSDDPELEFSPLGGRVTQDGVSMELHIYQVVGSDEGWALEVVDPTGTATAWDDYFPTDVDAYREFFQTMEREDVGSFLAEPDATVH